MLSRPLARIAALRGFRADLTAFALGLIAATALPPVYAVPVLLISVPGLLALIDGASNWAVALRRGWWFGFGHHLLGLYWVTEAILYEAARYWWFVPIAVPALAATLAIFIGIACAVTRLAVPGWPRAVALAGAWVLMDLARQFVLTGFPWNLWGSVWELPGIAGDVMIQPAAWVSIHGLTLATLLLAAAPARGWRWRIGALAGLAAWAVAGWLRLDALVPTAPGLEVVLVQGNVAQGQKWDQAFARSIFERYLRLTEQGVAQAGHGPHVVVWPETAFPGLLDIDPTARQMIEQADDGSPALIGSVRFDANRRPRNSLFAVTAGGTIVDVYDKWHLVPFGEFQPNWVPLPIIVVPGGGFASGRGPQTLHVPGLPPVGALICYEAIFPGQVVDSADRPAWLVNVTNDAWFGNSTGPRQHLAAARMRAVEEGLPMLRAANTGISAVIDAHGAVVARLGLDKTGTLVAPLPGALAPTPVSRMGLAAPAILAISSCAAGLGLGRRRGVADFMSRDGLKNAKKVPKTSKLVDNL